jgi:ribonuclease Z
MAPFDPSLAGELRLHGVRGDDEIEFGRYAVRVVECIHKIACVGYAFAEKKRRLKPEYQGQPGATLAQLRKQGTAIDEEIHQPLFAFVGDTHARVFETTPWLFDYPTIITECTFLDDGERERAERVGHTLWSQLRPTIEAHPDHTFVLIHFSLRYSDREVLEFFEREGLANVVVWAHPDSLLPEQHQAT